MSINVTLKRILNLPGRHDRKVELCFRGFTYKTRILQCENVAIFNEDFRWPHYGKDITEEVLHVSVYNCSRIFTDRLLGQMVISLQYVLTSGSLLLREPLTDINHSPTDIYVELDIRFQPVEGAPGRWKDLDFVTDEDNQSALVIRNEGVDDTDRSPKSARPNLLERDARRLGRSLLRMGNEDEDEEDEDDEDLVDLEVSDV
ncbi:fer-1-like protein 4, partial [Oryzias melastigma]